MRGNKMCAYNKIKTTAAICSIIVVLVSGEVSGAQTPTPKTYSTVTGENIVLSDVFDGVTENANFYLAPAPEMGKTKILSNKDLVRISKSLNLGWSSEDKSQRTIIRRAADVIQASEIKTLLEEKAKETIATKDFEIDLLNKNIKINIPEGADKTLKIDAFNYDASKMEVSATISSIATPEEKLEVKGTVNYINNIPVLSEPKGKGELILESDIEYIKVKSTDIKAGMITNAQDIIGKTPRNTLNPMAPLFNSDMKLPVLVKRGQVVTMNLNSGRISLTTQGLATQDGKKGDVIKIENITSKQIITAVVTGEREVNIITSNVQTAATM